MENILITHLVSLSSRKLLFDIKNSYECEIYKNFIIKNKPISKISSFFIILKVPMLYIKSKMIYFIYIILLKLGIKDKVKKRLKKMGFEFDE